MNKLLRKAVRSWLEAERKCENTEQVPLYQWCRDKGVRWADAEEVHAILVHYLRSRFERVKHRAFGDVLMPRSRNPHHRVVYASALRYTGAGYRNRVRKASHALQAEALSEPERLIHWRNEQHFALQRKSELAKSYSELNGMILRELRKLHTTQLSPEEIY